MPFRDAARVASNLVDPKAFLDMPHIAPNHIEAQSGRLLPYTTVRSDGVTSAKHLFAPGSVLYSKIRPYLAKVVVVDFEGLCSADMYPIASDLLEPRFLKWWMLHPEFTRMAAGEQARTVLPKINRRALDQLPVPVPPRDEQRRIVEILEDHLSRLDAATQYTRSARQRLTAFVQSERQRAVDGPSSPLVSLSELVERIETGKSLGGTSPATEHEWGIIKVSAMTWGAFRPEENKRIPEGQANPAYEIHEGDLLVSRANTSAYVGASVLVDKVRPRLLLSDKSLRLVPRRGVDAVWLKEVLQAPRTRQQISAMATGTKDSMRNISQKALLSVSVPDTPLAEQAAVLARARAAADSVRALSEAVDRAEMRAERLRRSLLAAAFSGRLAGATSELNNIEELVEVGA